MNRSPVSSHLVLGRRHRAWVGLGGVAALVTALLAALPSQAAPVPGPGGVAGDHLSAPTLITLITGELLRVSETADGRLAVARVAGDGAPSQLVQFTDAAGDLNVVPAGVLPLVPERLDPRLFNVSGLLRDGYGIGTGAGSGVELAGRGLPLLITYTGSPVAVPGMATSRELPSIGGAAARLTDSGDVLGLALAEAGSGQFLPGVKKVWLDGPVAASLDESVPQIGAPAAYDQGFDGTGVTIAVVDTGIDDSHPDLMGVHGVCPGGWGRLCVRAANW